MNIVGLNLTSRNSSACLIQDGVIVAFVEEERLIGLKMALNQVPLQALAYCLHKGNIHPNEIDAIAVGWDYNKYRLKMPIFLSKLFLENLWKLRLINSGGATGALSLLENIPTHRQYQIEMMLRHLGLTGKLPEIRFFEHHLAHAASTYFCSGFDQAVVLVLDGNGEEHCTTIFDAKKTELTLRRSIDIPNSIGWFYTAITEFLGFEPYEGEYKVMGLAPYGRFNDDIMKLMGRIVRIKGTSYEIDPQYLLFGRHTYGAWFSDEMVKLFSLNPRRNGQITDTYKDIAFCAQSKLEEVVLNLVKDATDHGRKRNLCLAGGVALNCKLVRRILSSEYVDQVFVQPSSNDAGSALGAAMLMAEDKKDYTPYEIKDVYYGPEYSNEIIEEILKASGLEFVCMDKPEKRAAEEIAKGRIVGWFQGRMECGPRALGNRSILANPMRREIKFKVNQSIKFREEWRPFAPSLLEEVKNDFLIMPDYAPFMTAAFSVQDNKRDIIPSVVHIDETTRPQTVRQSVNFRYWNLIYEFGNITNVPVILNTSLNIKGKPIACSPSDAINLFVSTAIDVMVINNYVISKK